jgi:hypothetical protein
MGFTFAYLKRVTPLAVTGAMVLSVQAQHSTYRPGQSILFSTPVSDTASSNTPSLSPQPPESPDFGGTVHAPAPIDFNGPVVDTPLPAGPSMIPPPEESLSQDTLDQRKNWLLMTPAEILGATTPEKILGIQEHDAFGQQKKSTALERYLERQNQTLSARPANTDTNAFPTWNFSDRQFDTFSAVPNGRGIPDSPSFKPASDNQTLAGQNESGRWAKLLDTPPLPVPTKAQETDMERFRQLLNPSASSVAVPASPLLNSPKSPLPQTALSSGLGQSALSPIGAAFTPLNSGISKPAEMPKLPSIWSQSLTSPPAAAVWAPQPPPWLSPTPQPFTAPQRKF